MCRFYILSRSFTTENEHENITIRLGLRHILKVFDVVPRLEVTIILQRRKRKMLWTILHIWTILITIWIRLRNISADGCQPNPTLVGLGWFGLTQLGLIWVVPTWVGLGCSNLGWVKFVGNWSAPLILFPITSCFGRCQMYPQKNRSDYVWGLW